jgi:S1-C subfamily serine protease
LAAVTVMAGAVLAACGTGASGAATASSQSFKLQSEYVKLVQDVGPSVVMIETSVGLGSGIIYDTTGDIVTNNHVVAGSQTFLVITSTGKQYPATVVGSFAPDDLAVVHVNASGLHPATFGNSSALQIGDIVMAIGNPLGLQSSVTQGIVSAMRTAIPEGSRFQRHPNHGRDQPPATPVERSSTSTSRSSGSQPLRRRTRSWGAARLRGSASPFPRTRSP